MRCLIIASGRGTRFSNRGEPKPLVPLLGLALIERVILTARKCGLNDFYVVIGYVGEKIKKHLEKFSKLHCINITYITNNEWDKENGISVLKAKDFIKDNFILLMSDHIFDEIILENLTKEKIADDEVILAVDYNIHSNKFIDIDDVTKVLVHNNKILDIGKTIDKYNAFDTGIFLCSPAIFSAIEQSIKNGDSSLSGGIKVLADKGKVKTFDIKEAYWIDVDNEQMLKRAERYLINNLKKTSDGPVSQYLNRPISTRITKYLVKTDITPNQISIFSFIFSVISAFLFFLGGYVNLLCGAVLVQFSSIIDGCDGEVARLKYEITEFGGWFDAILDRYADALVILGLIYYVYASNMTILPFFIGFIAMIGSFMNSYTAGKYDELIRRKIENKRSHFRFGRDIRILIIFISAIINQPLLALILLALLTNIENIRRVVVIHRASFEKTLSREIHGK